MNEEFKSYLLTLSISEAQLKEASIDIKNGLLQAFQKSTGGVVPLAGFLNRGDILKALKAQAIKPVSSTVDKMVEYYSTQLPYVDSAGLVQLYQRAGIIPNTFTRAQVKESNGLILDDIFQSCGGRAALLRAFRGTQPLLVKIPQDQMEASAELNAFDQLGTYDPSATCILGPVTKLELQREGRAMMELAIVMPICVCSVASVPRPAEKSMVEATALTLVTALTFLHSKNRVHGDVKLSNILIREDGHQFLAELGSSVTIGEKLVTTLSSLPCDTNNSAEDLKATAELDWYQAGLCLVHLLGMKRFDQRLMKEEVEELLSSITDRSLNIQFIVEKLTELSA